MNEFAEVEHGKKSLDYHPLIYVANQCEETQLWWESSKIPYCILTGKNECVGFDSPARFVNKEALMNPHE